MSHLNLEKIGQTANSNERFNQLSVNYTLLEFSIHIIFLILINLVAFNLVESTNYYFNKMMRDVLIDRVVTNENDADVSYEKISQLNDFWMYTEKILLPSILKNSSEMETDFSPKISIILKDNVLVGVPRLRQIRVRNDSCSIHTLFRKYLKNCYGFYTNDIEDKGKFVSENKTWEYEDPDLFNDEGFTWGQLTSYPAGGYIQKLNITLSESIELLKLLYNEWINRGTRVIFTEFSIYNPNNNIFCVAKFILELPPSGGIFPSYILRTVKLLRFRDGYDYFIAVLELILALLTFCYILVDVRRIILEKYRYFCSFWNWLDLMIIAISVCTLVLSVFKYILMKQKLEHIHLPSSEFISFDRIAFWTMRYSDLMAIFVFLIWIKLLKFINFNQSMVQFSMTLNKCAKDILGFGFMFLIVFIAFGELGYMFFGMENDDFRTLKYSSFTLMRTILGDFDYHALEKTNRILGPIYFMLFIFLVFFVLLNMFLAIISDTYSEVKTTTFEKPINLKDYFLLKYNSIIGKHFGGQIKIEETPWNNENLNTRNLDSSSEIENSPGNIMDKSNKTYEDQIEMLSYRIVRLEQSLEGVLGRYDLLIDRLLKLKQKK